MLGATNRINDIDPAILRRMPKKFPVSLPKFEQRLRILQLVLGDTKRDAENLDLDYIAKVTAGMSGSDIKEVCRDAAMAPVREYIRKHRATGAGMSQVNPDHVRGIRTEDFFGHHGGQKLAEPQPSQPSSTGANSKISGDEYEDVEEIPEDQVVRSA